MNGIPERVVHARGRGAQGFFENYKSFSKYYAPICSGTPENARRHSCGSPPWRAAKAHSISRATCAALPLVSAAPKFTAKKEQTDCDREPD
jgi:hypothetical protein